MDFIFGIITGTGATLSFFVSLHSLFIKKNNMWIFYSIISGIMGSLFISYSVQF
ncbi:hypothetical protein Dtox_2910 [Desulfofarcimen acetoxidans DSM 771]|uniref:Uncharacterized protein n=1 Tax=Desulfofarcimen acetoxidans (strain ATCC 49208 / DSM 771 / KCTC 5769 / VKM B-1644 / 5575) TaxID=485916 RepID=C8W2I4_DESAS|nr:hypothetical protein Dtox_2910 [Desulfofarcimen acetoxidans DSM 771]